MIQFGTSQCGTDLCVTLYKGKSRYSNKLDEIDQVVMKEALKSLSGSTIQKGKLKRFVQKIGLDEDESRTLFANIQKISKAFSGALTGLGLRSIYVKKGLFGLSHPVELIRGIGVVVHLKKNSFLVEKGKFLKRTRTGRAPLVETSHWANQELVEYALYK